MFSYPVSNLCCHVLSPCLVIYSFWNSTQIEVVFSHIVDQLFSLIFQTSVPICFDRSQVSIYIYICLSLWKSQWNHCWLLSLSSLVLYLLFCFITPPILVGRVSVFGWPSHFGRANLPFLKSNLIYWERKVGKLYLLCKVASKSLASEIPRLVYTAPVWSYPGLYLASLFG